MYRVVMAPKTGEDEIDGEALESWHSGASVLVEEDDGQVTR